MLKLVPPLARGAGGIILATAIISTTGLGETIAISELGIQPALAQRVNINDVWRQVYQQLPDLPKENNYVSKETGKAAENNTLVSRMIKYHYYVKGRAPNYRLDWKLTLADYLGANEIMYDTSYPGNDVLRKNPFEGDRAVITKLNRRQRDALVQALVNVFSPDAQNTPAPSYQPKPPDTQKLK